MESSDISHKAGQHNHKLTAECCSYSLCGCSTERPSQGRVDPLCDIFGCLVKYIKCYIHTSWTWLMCHLELPKGRVGKIRQEFDDNDMICHWTQIQDQWWVRVFQCGALLSCANNLPTFPLQSDKECFLYQGRASRRIRHNGRPRSGFLFQDGPIQHCDSVGASSKIQRSAIPATYLDEPYKDYETVNWVIPIIVLRISKRLKVLDGWLL